MKAWEKLGINSVLSHLGFNSVQMLDATIVVVNRLLDSCSENSLPAWVKTVSLADLLWKSMRPSKKDRFYRTVNLLHKNQEQIEVALRKKEIDLFDLD